MDMESFRTLNYIKNGLKNTLVADAECIPKQFKVFFGDGDITILEHNRANQKMVIQIKSIPYLVYNYTRTFEVSYCDANDNKYGIKISNITEL